jgi:hypothetical protein
MLVRIDRWWSVSPMDIRVRSRFFAGLASATLATAAAATGGDDCNPGTSGQPFATIGKLQTALRGSTS